MSSIGKLMKQAARIQKQLEAKQAELASRTIEATSGGGAVKVIAKCDGTLAAIKIDPQAVTPSDITLLEDLVLTAANNALSQAKEVQNQEMGSVAGGLQLPGLM
ncbi:MAG: YbaB/EbfC family nucleoid-associated protein [Verrucomicrobiales bacterium]|nr:YbaB/EbfC family nucleoid-associated protein [Verrucomicrobiales bacterium]